MIWFDLLCELSLLTKKNPKTYRSLFSETEEKQEISVLTDDPELIPMTSIMAELKGRVPTDTALFSPRFTTSTEKSIFANSVAFADAVSPYYNYSVVS